MLRFCDHLVTEAEAKIINLDSRNQTVSPQNIKEIYEQISHFSFKHNELENYFFSGLINDDSIPDLQRTYKDDFTREQWNKIIFFEYHWNKKHAGEIPESYEEVLESKWSFFLEIRSLLDFQNKMKKVTSEYITAAVSRRKAGDLLHGYIIESVYNHIPSKIDSDISLALQCVPGICDAFCIQCDTACTHDRGMHVYIEADQDFLGNHDDVYVLVSHALLSHKELCQEIGFFQKGTFDKYRDETLLKRLHFRDDLKLGCLQKELKFTAQQQLYDDIECEQHTSQCELCFRGINPDPFHWSELDIRKEWALHLPLEIQTLFEGYINQDYLQRYPSRNDISRYIKRKIVTLYSTNDCMLNVTNRKYAGILQEMNTFEIAFIHHNIGAMFEITLQTGISQSLKTAEKRLKTSADREFCYFKTYVKKYPMSYEITAGRIHTEVNLRQCYNILGMDNLVRLTMKRDPLPSEGRTNQVCTLPLTVKGLPKDHVVCDLWHCPLTCDQNSEVCNCKLEVSLTKDDAQTCLFTLRENEKAMCERFRRFITFGWSDLWCQKEIIDCLREDLKLEEPSADDETDYLNQSFESLKLTPTLDEQLLPDEDLCSDFSDDLSDDDVNDYDTPTNDDETDLLFGVPDMQLSDIDESGQNEETLTLNEEDIQFQTSSDEDTGMSEDEDLIDILQHLDEQDMAFGIGQTLSPPNPIKKSANGACITDQSDKVFGFTVFRPPPLMCRHPPPAIGRDDDIHKLREVLDEVLIRTGNVTDNVSSKILIAADHKIASNLFKLVEEDKKYSVFLSEFPLLHLRKSKIVNICSGYRDAGIIPLLMYLHDDEESDWMKLVNIQNIEIATRNIKRLSATLHITFLITFMKSLSQESRYEFLKAMRNPSSDEVERWKPIYFDFIDVSSKENATFALHRDIMSHCDEVISLAIAERIGGPEGYDLLLGTVKEALPFSFVNGASSYGTFCIQLLTEHYRSGIFYQNKKKHLFTGPHKGSSKNFALDAQREIEHKDALKGFRPRATTDNVVPRMSVVDDFLDIQAKRQLLFEEDEEEEEQQDIDIGCSITKRDVLHILPTVSMILRNNILQTTTEENPVNAYKTDRPLISKAILDKHSLPAARYLVEKYLSTKGLYDFAKADINLQDEDIPDELKSKVKRTSGTTIRRSMCKIKETKNDRQSKEIRRKKKVIQKQKEIDCLSSEMNACQAIMKPDCTKGSVQKALGMRKALFDILKTCLEKTVSETIDKNALSDVLKSKNLINVCCSTLPEEIVKSASIAIIEFAGVKFKTRAMTGVQYIRYVQNTVLGKLRQAMPNLVKLIVSEEKYQFTPDDLKAYTRESRKGTQKQAETIQHLKQSEEIISSEKFDKKAVISTSTGKSAVSKYLAGNLATLKLRTITLDIDSELILKTCEGCSDKKKCECRPYCVPLRATYGPFGFEGQEPLQIMQRKGEAEMSQVDWLISSYTSLNSGECVVSVVTSGDIDAIPIHLFAVSLFLQRNEKGTFDNKVFVMLQKPYGLCDIYCITDIVILIEKTHGLYSCVKTAFAMCMGGNDFIPKFQGISHQKVLSTFFDGFLNELFTFKFNNLNNLIGAEVNKDSYINFVKTLYCPKTLDSSKLKFEEIRQLSIKDPKHSEFKNPVKWIPPRSVLLSFAGLIDCQIDYLFTLGDHAASLPDFIGKGCLHRDTDGNVCYQFGDDVKFDRKEDLLVLDEKQLSQTLSSAAKRKSAQATKRSLNYTPQKGLRRKGRKVTTNIKTSTPR